MRLSLRALGLLLAAVISLGQATPQGQPPDALARARAHYNAQRYDAAIDAADAARTVPELANAALVVGARARLERFRNGGEPDDLVGAREALKLVDAARLSPRDQVEFLIAVGLTLFVDGCTGGCFSAAAEMFEEALGRSAVIESDQRELVFEWWAASLHRAAEAVPDTERAAIYTRIITRAEDELARHDGSASASYWLAAAARGAGQFERAWGAAIAGWVRSRYMGSRGATLRGDLDRFVREVLLPERARQLTPPVGDPRLLFEALLAQWEEVKRRWNGGA